MNVSPLDLRQQRFHSRFRGFDRIEVTSFLAAVADDYEQALRETDRLRQDLARMEAVLAEHRQHEQNLRATLMTAQKLSEDLKGTAEKEADRIIRDAEGRAQLMLVPPAVDDARQWFARLRDVRDGLLRAGVNRDQLTELSMGMSHDFEVAIEEGATMVRVGTAIFGPR